MIKGRQSYIFDRDAFTAARTKTETIDIVDPISTLDIIVEMTNGSAMTEASLVKPHDEFTSIEIVDGSDVLFSASMEELQALNVLETGKLPYMLLTLEDDAVQREKVTIFFGRFLNDPNFYLNPANFKNLQIRITNTFTTAAVTSWAASGHSLSVVAHIMESGYGNHMGFMQTKSMFSYTVVNTAIQRIEIPTDYAIRAIQVQSLMSTYGPDESISNLKMNCDSNKFAPFDIRGEHLQMQNINMLGEFQQTFRKRITGAATASGDLYYQTSAFASVDTLLENINSCTANAEVVTIQNATTGVESTNECLLDFLLHGSSLHSALYLPCGILGDPETWFRAMDYKDIKLELTGASALGVTKVLLQEART